MPHLALSAADTTPTAVDATVADAPRSATYRVPEENLPTLLARLETLNRRAARLGVARITHTTALDGEERYFRSPFDKQLGIESVRVWHAVTVTGATPRLGGWRFIAALHPTDEGTLVMTVPGEAVPPSYRDGDATSCAHCGTRRRRRATYVLAHTDGRTIQVGGQCLTQFLGSDATDPHAVARLAEWLADFDAWATGEGGSAGYGTQPTYDLEGFLAITAAVIRVRGWVSATRAREEGGTPTVSHVWSYLDPSGWGRATRDAIGRPTAEDTERARAAIAWAEAAFVAAPNPDALSDYEHNLALVVRAGRVLDRAGGLAASLLAAHARFLARESERVQRERLHANLAATSRHQGTPKRRADFGAMDVVARIDLPASARYDTVRALVKLVDDAGNLFVWFATGAGAVDAPPAGTRVTVRATVKDHDTYDGVAQTILTRAALTVIQAAPGAEPDVGDAGRAEHAEDAEGAERAANAGDAVADEPEVQIAQAA